MASCLAEMSDRGTVTVAPRHERVVRRWRVQVVAGPAKGRVRRLGIGLLRVGSGEDNELVLDDEKVSRHHLAIALRPGGAGLRDLKSKNGTYYLGSRVQELELSVAGGAVTLGDSELSILPDDA